MTASVDGATAGLAVPAQLASYVAPAADPAADIAAASGLRRQVFGFLPYWEVPGASTRLNYDVLSTIAYFSVGADRAGNIRKKGADGSSTTGWGGWTSSSMSAVIRDAHSRGTRVVLTASVFAWTSSQAAVQRALLGSATARRNLAHQLAAAVRDRGADGVNLDFEPLASGYADEFVALLRTLRTELNKVHAGYQITYDTTGFIGNYPLEASVAKGAADAIFVMGYDYRTASSSTAGSVDPLSGPGYDLADTVRSYTARVPASRVILGIPWYGRAWSTVSSSVRSKSQGGLKYGYSAAVNYENVLSLVAQHGRRWDPVEQSPYVVYRRQNCTPTYGCVTSWREVYYDDAASMRTRYALVNDYGLRGAGIWALGYDGGHSELYRALSESFLVDKSGPQAGIRVLAPSQVDEGFIVSWAAKDVSSIASYDIQASIDGHAWTAWLTGTRATSAVWMGRDGHGYAFRVRARDSRHNLGPWNVTATWDATPSLAVGGFARVRLDGLSYRTGPDSSAAKLGSLPLNTIVALTRGPISADGYTWWEVTQPIRQWGPVSFVERGVWVASSSSSATYLSPARAPNSTSVNAGLVGMDFGSGARAVGSTAAALATRRFSPNGDGSGDALRIRWTNTVALDTLKLNVYRTNGTLAGSQAVSATSAGGRAWAWNGRAGGRALPDGRYVLQLVGTAGGATYRAPSVRPVTPVQVAAYAVTLDRRPPVVVRAGASGSLISPNGDGRFDAARFTLSATGGVRWTATVTPAAGGAVARSVSGPGTSVAFTWNGTRNDGTRAADGRYQVTIAAWDEAGNHAGRSYAVTLDTTPPAVVLRVATPRISPDGDGMADSTALGWSASELATGTARILRGSTVVRSWTISRRSTWSATWNGRTGAGGRVGDGTYTFRVDVRDAGGNRRVLSRTVTVDRTLGILRWSRDFFAQDNDAIRPSAALSFRLGHAARTTLRLYDDRGTLVRTVWTRRSMAAGNHAWTWNGRLANGAAVPQGRYRAELTATSSMGTTVLSRTTWVAAFAISPSATTIAPGRTLTIRFRSVEPLSTRPTVTFIQPGHAGVRVTATRLADGTWRASFTVRSGPAGAGSVTVSARDSAGRGNSTTTRITIAS